MFLEDDDDDDDDNNNRMILLRGSIVSHHAIWKSHVKILSKRRGVDLTKQHSERERTDHEEAIRRVSEPRQPSDVEAAATRNTMNNRNKVERPHDSGCLSFIFHKVYDGMMD